jgi:hypothetical protein
VGRAGVNRLGRLSEYEGSRSGSGISRLCGWLVGAIFEGD